MNMSKKELRIINSNDNIRQKLDDIGFVTEILYIVELGAEDIIDNILGFVQFLIDSKLPNKIKIIINYNSNKLDYKAWSDFCKAVNFKNSNFFFKTVQTDNLTDITNVLADEFESEDIQVMYLNGRRYAMSLEQIDDDTGSVALEKILRSELNQVKFISEFKQENIDTNSIEKTEVKFMSDTWSNDLNELYLDEKVENYNGTEVKLNVIEDSIAIVSMQDKENKNMFSKGIILGLMSKFLQIKRNSNIKVVILTGYNNIFSMGGTYEELMDIANKKSDFTDLVFMYKGLLDCELPVISAIQGHAVGGGLAFGLYGDIIVMAEDCTYSANFMNHGFTPGLGATFILGKKLGENLAGEMMFTGKTFEGQELKQKGAPIIFKKRDEVLNEALKIAKNLVQKPIDSLKVLKKDLSERILKNLDDAIKRELIMHDKTFHNFAERNEEKVNRVIKREGKEEKVNSVIKRESNSKNLAGEKNKILNKVINIVASVLMVAEDEIQLEQEFKDLGVDSISSIEIITRINKSFNLELESVFIYDYPTVKRLGEQIFNAVSENTNKISEMLEEIDNEEKINQVITQEDSIKKIPEEKKIKISNKNNTLKNSTEERNKILNKVINIVASVLMVAENEIQFEQEFKDLGVDSISSIEIITRINKSFNLELESVFIYDYPTVRKLGEQIFNAVSENTNKISDLLEEIDAESEVKEQVIDIMDSDKEIISVNENVSDVIETEQSVDKIVINNIDLEKKIKLTFKHTLTPVHKDVSQEPEEHRSKQGNIKEGIAIIGVAGRFPKAENVEELWNNLINGVDAITEIPKDRWTVNQENINWGGFIDDVDKFDSLFFGISPKEAELMDPQQRILLENVWKTIEDAGYKMKDLAGSKTGVYIGAIFSDYSELLRENDIEIEGKIATGNLHSIISNRISYLLDLKGPSETIDTACSSSLVAIYNAVKAILDGDCDMAIAGGVNLILTHTYYESFSKAGMLSPDGRCKTFDKSANGYVRGEGVGTILLKSLDKAIADGDHVYAVIRGAAVNHGGHTNSLTAPSANSQSDLIVKAWSNTGLLPTYIEAHGTGTSLGDPIEISGLKKAFKEIGMPSKCGIGTVKSNIGHLEGAAGITGIIKVLLAMKYGELPQNLHFKELNPYIKLDDTNFYIMDKFTKWEEPRIAGVSSFGFGGVNAHIVLQEYVETNSNIADKITEREGNRVAGVSSVGFGGVNAHVCLRSDCVVLADRSDTNTDNELQIIVLSAKNKDRLGEYVQDMVRFISKNRDIKLADLAYTLQVGREEMDERLAVIVSSLEGLKEALVNKKNIYTDNIKQIKVKDLLIDGEEGEHYLKELIEHKKLNKLAKLWVSGVDIDWSLFYKSEDKLPMRISLPTYPFEKRRYWVPETIAEYGRYHAAKLHELIDSNESTLREQCFKKILRGDEFYLRDHIVAQHKVLPGSAYLEMARVAGELADKEQKVAVIRDVTWIKPIVQNDSPKEVYVGLYLEDRGVAYEIYSGDDRTIYSQGTLEYGESLISDHININEIKGRCGKKLSSNECYGIFDSVGISYGEMFRTIREYCSNEEECLALLEVDGKRGEFVLHPSIIDGAFQAVIGIMGHVDAIYVPFAIEEMSIVKPTGSRCYAYAKKVDRCIFDIIVADEAGNVLVQIKGFEVREFARGEKNVMYFTQSWETEVAESVTISYGTVVVIRDTEVEGLPIYGVFDRVRELVEKKDAGNTRLIYVCREDKPENLAVSGFLKTLQIENPRFECKVLVSNDDSDIEKEIRAGGEEVKYVDGLRYVKKLRKVKISEKKEIEVKEGGVYLITGGAGGLGLIFADYLAKKARVKLVLVGSSDLTSKKKEKINNITGDVVYMKADISDKGEVDALLEKIVQNMGRIDGVIHAAGVIRDSFIIKKTEAQIREVIGPKIYGTINLYEALRGHDLDFFVLFSSVAGVLGNMGQCDYAYANSFIDNFAAQNDGVISINWPLWQDGGMGVDEETVKHIKEMGMELIENTEGIRGFEVALSNGISQLTLIKGDSDSIINVLTRKDEGKEDAAQSNNSTIMDIDKDRLISKAREYLKDVLSQESKILKGDISSTEKLEKYGIDSIMILKLNSRLEKVFGKLSKTLFFEYQTIEEILAYFIKNHKDRLAEIFAGADEFVEQKKRVIVVNEHQIKQKQRFLGTTEARKNEQHEIKDIAIIGISGRYPMADDINEFWENLKQGRDCITEIPKERWDNGRYFDENRGKVGKTYSKWGGFINDVDKFDPLFFSISPREAEIMDPQERVFLETVWHAMEDAGYTRNSVGDSKVGVFVGVMYGQYQLFGAEDYQFMSYSVPSSSYASIANRVSYVFNLHGPSVAMDTMCSSSLTAIHFACESIKKGESEIAIAGGVNVSIHPNKYIMLSQGGFVSSDGRCRSFGEGGDGYVPGEGVGAILLKPLDKAIEDGDNIYAVIKGSSLNHGGKTNGYTVPNPNAQGDLILETLKKAGINPREISYIEAHGTGTSLGDPIEITGLARAFREYTDDKQYCSIGSAKSNIGHLESAAGIAGITKVVLQMKYRQLVPSIHSDKLNPNIDFEESPFYVQHELTEWKRPETDGQRIPRRAGISSFGAGGSNAYIVLEEYVPVGAYPMDRHIDNPQIIVLSAKNKDRLDEYISRIVDFADKNKEISLADLSYTLQVGREAMDERLAVIVSSLEELKEALVNKKDIYTGNINPKKAKDLLIDEEEGEHYLKELIEHKKLNKLAKLWVSGVDIDWSLMHKYRAEVPRRISLPTYPFEKERYWVSENRRSQAIGYLESSSTDNIDKSNKLFSILEKDWKKSNLREDNSWNIPESLIVIVNEKTKWLANEIFKGNSKTIIQDVENVDDISRGFRDVAGIIDVSDIEREDYSININKVKLLQLLIKNIDKDIPFILHFRDEGSLAGADIAGFMKVIGSEYSKIGTLKTITINYAQDNLNAEKLERIVLSEVAENLFENEICYRQGNRYIPQIRKIYADADMGTVDNSLANFDIDADKVIAITGGTRGIGRMLAENLVQNGAKKLVLMGISGDTDVAGITEEFRRRGAEARIYIGLLTDKGRLEEYFREIRQDFGQIQGVIHCAGSVVNENPSFINKKEEDIRRVLQPKIEGTQVLHEIFEKDGLKFFILFSSVSGFIPVLGVGLSDYAAANSYLNYFADFQHNKGNTYYKSVIWPSFKESGMGEVTSLVYKQLGLLTHTDKEAVFMLNSVMGFIGKSCLLPCMVDENIFDIKNLLARNFSNHNHNHNHNHNNNDNHNHKNIKEDNGIKNVLKKLFCKELKIPMEKLKEDVVFGDLGVDSIILAELVKKIEGIVSSKVDPSILLEHNTLNLLADYIGKNSNLKIAHSAKPSEIIGDLKIRPDISYVSRDIGSTKVDKIAVIGMGCHFPGAKNKNEYWNNLCDGVSSIREIPPGRWSIEEYYDKEPQLGKSYGKWGGFIEGIELFDPEYFGLNEEEAFHMDPLIRQFMEVSTEAVADAGYSKEDVWGRKVGVFVGSRVSNYGEHIKIPLKSTIVGLGQNFIAAHLAHFFNLKGPNMVVDTACSSSLVSIHLACQSLIMGESEMAVAGGVDILLDERPYLILSKSNALSPDGKCHTFDEKANGFVPGEGAGAVILKPLNKAIADGDKIYAVIEASAVNNDGHTMGITTPNPDAQKGVIDETLGKAGINPENIGYIETHGTGTMIGDPIELKALTGVFRKYTDKSGFCGVGSVKTNFGHLLSAAGIASFIKVVLSLYNGKIPPTLNCEVPNPRFEFDASPFYPNLQLANWQANGDGTRIAGISAFGFGGTNSHIIVSDFKENLVYGYKQKNGSHIEIIFNKKRYWNDERISEHKNIFKLVKV